LSGRDRELVVQLCAARAGLRIDPAKTYLIENRLGPIARREGFGSVEELLGAIRDRGAERLIWAVVEAMSPSETSFFRDPGAFDLVASEVLPELARNREGGTLRVWAAACGAGQEAHSLAMLLDEQAPRGVTIEFHASDLCERRLEKAQSGLYSQFEVQRGLSARRLIRHFESHDDGFALSPRVRQAVHWRRVNLFEDISRLGRFDLIFCRNILAGYEPAARKLVLAHLAGALAAGGSLILGAGESAAGLQETPGRPSFYFRPSSQAAAA
jgi:chemotaxis protein methyltransferase CheR